MNTYVEEWKDIPTWEDVYQMNEFGVISNKITKRKMYGSFDKSTGYYKVTLCYKGRKEQWLLHRLVATVFQRPLLEGEEGHHCNKLKFCNCKWNIEILSEEEHNEKHKDEHINRSKDYKFSEQVIKKRVETRKNNNNGSYNKNGNMSQEQRKKISNKMKGIKRSPETIAKREETKRLKRLAEPNYGRRKANKQLEK